MPVCVPTLFTHSFYINRQIHDLFGTEFTLIMRGQIGTYFLGTGPGLGVILFHRDVERHIVVRQYNSAESDVPHPSINAVKAVTPKRSLYRIDARNLIYIALSYLKFKVLYVVSHTQ